MKKVLTFGVFDYFHLGHLNLFEKARSHGDYLIVAVQEGDYILRFKPGAKVLYTTEQRLHIINSLRIVDEAVVYQSVDQTIQNIDFDVFAIGEDQNHTGFQKAVAWCNQNGKQVVRIQRTQGICSSDIKNDLNK